MEAGRGWRGEGGQLGELEEHGRSNFLSSWLSSGSSSSSNLSSDPLTQSPQCHVISKEIALLWGTLRGGGSKERGSAGLGGWAGGSAPKVGGEKSTVGS